MRTKEKEDVQREAMTQEKAWAMLTKVIRFGRLAAPPEGMPCIADLRGILEDVHARHRRMHRGYISPARLR